ncbi:choice-of-anchor Q domain-containing protein [Arenicella xantha]|uniref:CSLREA domain-containing protein n=1 Tax=Arenicella xantha TaxID=644221 RepID=A0A395JNV0_9GAMM|nr:choice-of-anchor Q domain-containing protein [Arenicella xantha]RBP51258.1 CSLREA domain-containing protein [Arenicella xantha]
MNLDKHGNTRNIRRFKKTLLALAIPFAASTGHAAIFVVNSDVDSAAGCTLREAVQTANANMNLDNGCGVGSAAGVDTIEFSVSSVKLANGELTITDDVYINPSANDVTIDAANTSRIFNIVDAKVTLSHLTLTGGDGSDGGLPKDYDDGGAIYVNRGNLILQNTVLYGNTAVYGSGGAIAARADLLTINDSQIHNNTAVSGGGISDRSDHLIISDSQVTSNTATMYDAGGIFVGSDTATITGATISGNSAKTSGGGLSLSGTSASISNSSVSNNYLAGISDDGSFFGGRGGGLEVSSSSLSIVRSQISLNTATGSGGGIYTIASDVSVQDSSISSNRAQALGEVSTAIGGGGIYITMRSSSFASANSQITLHGSTIANNVSGHDGGGILNAPQAGNGETIIDILNSTISNNSAANLGGGVHQINESEIISYGSTLSENTSVFGAGGISANGSDSFVSLSNTIVAGNRSEFSSSEIRLDGGSIFTLEVGHNVLGRAKFTTAESFSGVPITGDNIFATSDGNNPQILNQIISPLSNNGGPTRTHALPIGSIAIDNGDAFICDLYFSGADQRGPNNRQDSHCDIGSVEYFIEDDACFVVPTANAKLVTFCL